MSFVLGALVSTAHSYAKDYMVGGIRMYDNLPPIEDQNAECRDPLKRTLSFGMGFVGIDPWISNLPTLERNCASLIELKPLSIFPWIKSLDRPGTIWSRVVRVKMPRNAFGYIDSYGFGWCSDASCRSSMLVAFADLAVIGYCSQDNGGKPTFLLMAPDLSVAYEATQTIDDCISNPKETLSLLATTDRAPGAKELH